MKNSQDGLVVPVRVEALLVSHADTEKTVFMPANADFSRLPTEKDSKGYVYLSQSALNQPFTGEASRQAGIYLHWFLPKALRKGNMDSQGVMQLHQVPDRWLVVRSMINPTDNTSTQKAWVVESNYLSVSNTYSNTTLPWNADEKSSNTWRYLGRVYDYNDWLVNGNKGQYYTPLNAWGYGIPDFASYYPNCANVFTLFDGTLTEGNKNYQLSYSVTGWYSSADNDPLYQYAIYSTGGNDFNWTFDDDNKSISPFYTLCQGCIRNISWNPSLPGGYLADAADPAGLDLAIGNTAAEAVAALVARAAAQPSSPAEQGAFSVEQLLNAAQIGALQTLGAPGGLADFEERLFNLQFTPLQGGLCWEIQPQQGKKAQPLPPGLLPLLHQLNKQQSDYDQTGFLIQSLQQQLYADWNKFMLIQHIPPQPPVVDINDLYGFLEKQMDCITQKQEEAADLERDIDNTRHALSAQLPDGMELLSVPAPRYYQPNDPVLLMAGPDIPDNPPDNADSLNCVLTSKLVLSVHLPAGLLEGSAAFDLQAAWLPGFGNVSALPYAGILAAWQSTQLQNPDWVNVLTALLAAKGGANNPAVINFKATSEKLATALQEWLTGKAGSTGIQFNGCLPQAEILSSAWRQPWNPVAICWGFDFTRLSSNEQNNYPEQLIVEQLLFDYSNFNYEYPEDVYFGGAPEPYQGINHLSSGATADLKNQLSQYLKYISDPELQKILDGLQTTNMLAQSLGGFHHALSMLMPAMQLPVADPAAINKAYDQLSNEILPPVIGLMNQRTPQLNFIYNPLRAGYSVLRQLAITDSFGRFKKANLNELIVSENIPTIPGADNVPPQLLLPPRIAQPMQLRFCYLSAADHEQEMTSHPEDSPICGWVVPNHLDNSLLFYDADGTAIGSMYTTADNSEVYWMNAPGKTWATNDIADGLSSTNSVLNEFVMATFDKGAGYISNLIRTFDHTATYVIPDSRELSASTSVLIGTPMALVQTGLRLRVQGMVSPAQDFDTLNEDIRNGDPLQRSTQGLTEMAVPVLLGSLTELNDGLYGYFLTDEAGQYDFSTFYSQAAQDGMEHIVAPTASTLCITAAATADTRIAMLIDPRCEVHAYAGVLPVQSINIPDELYASAADNLAFTFLSAPVLWAGQQVALPVPGEGEGTWTWASLQRSGWQSHSIGTINQSATLQRATSIQEGWLQLDKKDQA